MKIKFIIFFVLILLLSAIFVSCNVEGVENESPAESESHTETEQATEQTTEHVHVFSEWNTITAPSCTTDGVAERECAECSLTEQKKLPQTSHSFAQTIIPPTCTDKGYTLYECKCGYTKKDDFVPTYVHTLTSTITLPTCTSQGYNDYKCKYCDYTTRGNYVDPLPHARVSVTTPPTCTSQGYTDHTCKRCDFELRDSYVDKLPHSFTSTVTYPTLLRDGYTTYTCDCTHVETSDYVSYSEIFSGAYVENTTVLAKGIDVSKWNHETGKNGEYLALDWNAIKASGVDFVILKCGSTKSGIEPTFEMDYEGARAAGLEIGVYFYTYSTTVDAVKQDAELLLSALDGKYFEYPIYLDLEDISLEALGKNILMDMCTTFITTLQTNGYYAALYTNHNWITYILDRESVVSSFDVWYARYPETNEPVWNEEKYGKQLGMWQYSEKGKIDGFDCDFDLNYAYKNYKELMVKWGLNGFEAPST